MRPGGRLRTWGAVSGEWAFFLLLPFVILWRFAPLVTNKTIGNDYTLFTFESQLEFVWSWRHGLVPLFMPNFAGGASASTMTLGQPWHPMTWLCGLTPGFGSGHPVTIGTIYRFLELGLTTRFVYRESRLAGLAVVPSLALSIAVVFNGRMLDSFRYGASLETYCGMLLACTAFAAARREGWTFRRIVWGAATIYLTLVGGHPQWALFGVMGACLFAAGLLVRPSPDEPRASRGRFFGGVVLSGIVGGALSAGYALPFRLEFMAENSGRVDQTYAFTTGYSDTVRGTLANFSRPLESDVHGAFGGTIWQLALVCSIPVALVWLRRPLAIVLPAVVMVGTLFFAFGTATPLHRWVVEHVPLFSSFRVPGRATLLLPPMMLLIGWVSLADLARPELRRSFARGPVIAWAGALALGAHLAFQLVFKRPTAAGYAPILFSGSAAWVDGVLVAAEAVAAAMLVLSAIKRPKLLVSAWAICLVATTASASLALSYGTWIIELKPHWTFEDMDAHHSKYQSFWGYAGLGLEPKAVARANEAKLSLARPKGALAERWTTAESDEQAVARAVKHKGEIVLSGPSVAPRESDETPSPDAVTLRTVQWNRWQFTVDAPRGGAFIFGQPKLPQWEATVDGRKAEIITADGTFPALMLEPGTHEIDVRFRSRATIVGMAVVLVTLLGMLVASYVVAQKKTWRRRGVSIAMALSLLAFGALWYRALWSDVDIRTFAEPADNAKKKK